MEVVYRRLEGQYRSLGLTAGTASAERALGIPPQAYFYVHRVVPAFGEHVVAFMHNSVPDLRVVSPFDSGGFARRHIPLRWPTTARVRRWLFDRYYSYGADRYLALLREWVSSAFDHAHDYVQGVRPVNVLPSVIKLAGCNDDRAWTWETRLPLNDYASAPLKPLKVYLAAGHMTLYTRWLRNSMLLDEAATIAHLTLFHSVAEEVSDGPARAMQRYLLGELEDLN